MSSIRIPEERQIGLKYLLELNGAAYQELLAALRKISIFDPGELIARVANDLAETTTQNAQDIQEILPSLFPLYSLKVGFSLSTEEIIEEIVGALREQGIAWQQPEIDLFQERLRVLLDLPVKSASEEVAEKFYRLAAAWKAETAHLSSITKMIAHPKYLSIIGLGAPVLPLLFKELQHEPDYWFWALSAITEADPIPEEHYGDLDQMAEDWLDWAREHSYL